MSRAVVLQSAVSSAAAVATDIRRRMPEADRSDVFLEAWRCYWLSGSRAPQHITSA